MSEPPRGRSVTRRNIQIALSLAVVAIVFVFALPQFADFSKVWAVMRNMTWLELLTLVIAAAWNIATYWIVMVGSLPGSNYWQAMKVNQASTAISNTVPGGGAIGIGVTYAMYSAYGFSRNEVGLSVLVSGLWNNFAKLALPIVALALLAVQGDAGTARLVAALVGIGGLVGALAMFALVLRSDRLAHKIGDRFGSWVSSVRGLLHRSPVSDWGEAFAGFRRDAIDLLRRRWVWLTAATLVSHLSLYLVLLLTLRHVGVSDVEVGWAAVLAAFSFARLATALPITPGGLGVVELVLTASLVSAGGPRAPVVAAVLIYRILTYVVPIGFGLLAYLKWTRGMDARRVRAEERRREYARQRDVGARARVEEPTP
ncbi:MAG TPA: flippase-like domain-containing protein [Actinomycetota bacterium]|nr:flippase-like domain-containing protein [Actinomycetota bacterium]